MFEKAPLGHNALLRLKRSWQTKEKNRECSGGTNKKEKFAVGTKVLDVQVMGWRLEWRFEAKHLSPKRPNSQEQKAKTPFILFELRGKMGRGGGGTEPRESTHSIFP